MGTMKLLAVGLLAALVSSGCASMPRMSDAARLAVFQRHAGPPVRHVMYSGIGPGFEVVDGSHLFLDGGPARSYLLTLGGNCMDYDRNGVFLGIDSLADGQLDAGLDRVVLQREPRLRCAITAIQQVDLRALRADPELVRRR